LHLSYAHAEHSKAATQVQQGPRRSFHGGPVSEGAAFSGRHHDLNLGVGGTAMLQCACLMASMVLAAGLPRQLPEGYPRIGVETPGPAAAAATDTMQRSWQAQHSFTQLMVVESRSRASKPWLATTGAWTGCCWRTRLLGHEQHVMCVLTEIAPRTPVRVCAGSSNCSRFSAMHIAPRTLFSITRSIPYVLGEKLQLFYGTMGREPWPVLQLQGCKAWESVCFAAAAAAA